MTIVQVVVLLWSLAVTIDVPAHPSNVEVSVVLTPERKDRADLWKTQTLEGAGGRFVAAWPDLEPGAYAVSVVLVTVVDGELVQQWFVGGRHVIEGE